MKSSRMGVYAMNNKVSIALFSFEAVLVSVKKMALRRPESFWVVCSQEEGIEMWKLKSGSVKVLKFVESAAFAIKVIGEVVRREAAAMELRKVRLATRFLSGEEMLSTRCIVCSSLTLRADSDVESTARFDTTDDWNADVLVISKTGRMSLVFMLNCNWVLEWLPVRSKRKRKAGGT